MSTAKLYAPEESLLLVKLIAKNQDVLDMRCGKTVNNLKQKAWDKITEEYNKEAVVKRTPASLKIRFKSMKAKISSNQAAAAASEFDDPALRLLAHLLLSDEPPSNTIDDNDMEEKQQDDTIETLLSNPDDDSMDFDFIDTSDADQFYTYRLNLPTHSSPVTLTTATTTTYVHNIQLSSVSASLNGSNQHVGHSGSPVIHNNPIQAIVGVKDSMLDYEMNRTIEPHAIQQNSTCVVNKNELIQFEVPKSVSALQKQGSSVSKLDFKLNTNIGGINIPNSCNLGNKQHATAVIEELLDEESPQFFSKQMKEIEEYKWKCFEEQMKLNVELKQKQFEMKEKKFNYDMMIKEKQLESLDLELEIKKLQTQKLKQENADYENSNM